MDATPAAPPTLAWFVEAGHTRRNARVEALGLRREGAPPRALVGARAFVLEARVGRWRAGSGGAEPGEAVQLALVPLLQWPLAPASAWFVEAGIGLSWHDRTREARAAASRTRWNFEDVLALGRVMAPGHTLSLRYAHVSNAGLREPNPGEDRLMLRWSASF